MTARLVLRAIAISLVLAFGSASRAGADGPGLWSLWTPCSGLPVAPPAPAAVSGATYYAVELVPTRRVVGTGLATGVGRVAFANSPFGVAVTPQGEYVQSLEIGVNRLRRPPRGVLTAWVATPELDRIERLGVLDGDLRVSGHVRWNKFLLVITLEPQDDPEAARWTGPVVLRGMSRSGMMHTMAGHGPFEQEPCSKYGYDD